MVGDRMGPLDPHPEGADEAHEGAASVAVIERPINLGLADRAHWIAHRESSFYSQNKQRQSPPLLTQNKPRSC